MKLDDKVKISNIEKVNNDQHLEESALNIIKKSEYKGIVTKIVDDVFFVGFKNELGWVTQGFKKDEIEVI